MVLGVCYVVYGVCDEYYDIVGGVFLDIFDVVLGVVFMFELCEVWGEFYGCVSWVMWEVVFCEVLVVCFVGVLVL